MKIDIGDKVNVYCGGTCFQGKVNYMPAATGDSWIIEEENGNVHYVQTFEQIIKYSPQQK